MTEALASVLKAAEALSIEDQELLWLCLRERFSGEQDADLSEEQWAEIDRRGTEVERGEAELIPGEEVLAYVRERVAAVRRGE
jgi:hypothetical protein